MAAKYLTRVGQLQWLVTLGRFDIHAQVATMSMFRAAPRQGHMDRLKRIYSYAIRTKDYAIGSFPELCIYLAFGRISFHLHYICISFALHLHFICISHSPQN